MRTQVEIDNKHRAVVLEVEDIDPANFEDVSAKVLNCALRIGATTSVEVSEDSVINFFDEPECETGNEE